MLSGGGEIDEHLYDREEVVLFESQEEQES